MRKSVAIVAFTAVLEVSGRLGVIYVLSVQLMLLVQHLRCLQLLVPGMIVDGNGRDSYIPVITVMLM